MWLFTTMGFISAVVDRNDSTRMFVRSRNVEHLRALFPGAEVIDSVEQGMPSDYRYRVHVARTEVRDVVTEYVMQTQASNFKAAAAAEGADVAYLDALHDVWEALARTQQPEPYAW